MKRTRIAAGVLSAAALTVGLTACSGGDDGDSGGGAASPSSAAPSSSAAAAPASDQPFGAACSTVPASGKGSFSGMATDPVATAASNNPALSTLVSAVKEAGLVDTLNSAQDITVFAPTNDAFKKIPKGTLDKVMADKKMLKSILTYHVVGQKVAPSALASGSFKTLQGGTVTTSGSGESFTVGTDKANVVCGNVQTANATVYLIDSVLMPPK
ncbi:fasciclin domain-containing protein [Actinomadura darangshiensis]|uniref:Fasciclin domain-containing protein n=1 Tax=Actinomadura darangshiensis TaxID=705336 RepID=A0A4R5BFJ8_9ACTN|nr:fasciclin domain-containing protein [Actinomadura darangshiensis]TDD85131.1 fasciclin domain-containing protein [Actinomadura darangshiensis]